LKTIIRMMLVFWVLGIFYPQISKTNISYHNVLPSMPSLRANQVVNDSTGEMNTQDYVEMLEELFALDISEQSKVKAIKEAFRLGQLKNLSVIKEDCLEFFETSLILKCMEVELVKIKRADLLSIPGNVADIFLGSCIKMESYNDEKICYETIIHKFLPRVAKIEATKCLEISELLEKVFCYRRIL